ncbi:unnamed protein product [Chrysoparadoxa australica]
MQKIWMIVVIVIVSFSCASSKKATDISVGNWDYTVKGTPNGNVTGYFMILKDGDNYSGSINGNQGSTPFETISILDKTLNATFDYSGYPVTMKGAFEGNTFTGTVTVDYNNFPITATKQE